MTRFSVFCQRGTLLRWERVLLGVDADAAVERLAGAVRGVGHLVDVSLLLEAAVVPADAAAVEAAVHALLARELASHVQPVT
jgi:hypothetical protein